MDTIKKHLAKEFAQYISSQVKTKWNNNQSMYENECNELAELIRIELLELNGYNEKQ